MSLSESNLTAGKGLNPTHRPLNSPGQRAVVKQQLRCERNMRRTRENTVGGVGAAQSLRSTAEVFLEKEKLEIVYDAVQVYSRFLTTATQ